MKPELPIGPQGPQDNDVMERVSSVVSATDNTGTRPAAKPEGKAPRAKKKKK